MTLEEMLKMDRLETDAQNEEAISFCDDLLKVGDMESPQLEKISDLIYEFEERTDVLNRKERI